MSKTVHITSPSQFTSLLQSSTIVVVDFYADWCQPCKVISPIFEQLSQQLSRPNKVTFTKVNSDDQTQIAQSYKVSGLPTFLVFKKGKEIDRVTGADPQKLTGAVRKLAAEADSISANGSAGEASSAGAGSSWRGAELPRGYDDITDQVDAKDLDMLNSDGELGSAKTLFTPGPPSSLDAKGKGKGASGDDGAQKDWVESDTDEQLMLFVPFQSTVKVHTMHVTSLPPPPAVEDGGDEPPMRPKTIHLYTNRAHNLGFEEAEDTQATQVVELQAGDWDNKTGTARVELRFVKFQNVTSLVVFVVNGDGDGERVRLDRIRFIGETGEKRAMGKLEKVGEEQ